MKNTLLKLSTLATAGFFGATTVRATIFEGAGDGGRTDTQQGVDFVNTALAGSGITPTGDFALLILKYINFFLPYLALVAFIGYVVAGVLFIVSFGSEDMIGRSKKIFIYSTIGLILVIVAYAIVQLLTSALVEFINKP